MLKQPSAHKPLGNPSHFRSQLALDYLINRQGQKHLHFVLGPRCLKMAGLGKQAALVTLPSANRWPAVTEGAEKGPAADP